MTQNQPSSLFEQPLDLKVVTVNVSQIEFPAGTETNPAVEKPGVLQSVLLAPTGNPECPYRVVDGKRRVRSAVKYGHETVPAIITDGSRGQIAAAAAMLNSARGSNPLDEARNWQIALEEGRYLSIKELAHDVRVNVSTIQKRLKLLRLPEHLLAHVGGLLSEGVAINMANLPDEYLEDAVIAAEQKVLSGDKFTAADFKESQTRRRADRDDAFDSLFAASEESLPTLFEPVSPLQHLVSEVQRLCALSGVDVAELVTKLSQASVLTPDSPSAAPTAPVVQVQAPGTISEASSLSPVSPLDTDSPADDDIFPNIAVPESGDTPVSVTLNSAEEDDWLSDFMDATKSAGPSRDTQPAAATGRTQLGLRSA